MRPVIIIDDENFAPPTKERVITIYKQALFEDMDAESRRFTLMRPDLPEHQSDITASEANIQNTPYVRQKERVITISKQRLYEDIDAESYKYAEAKPNMTPEQANASGSDSAERLDGHIIARLVEHCDANLRKRVMRYLKNDTVVTSEDNDLVLDPSFVFTFILPAEFNDSMMETLKNYIHRYFVWGALYDWYGASLGSDQAKWFQNTLKGTEDAIVRLVSRIDGHLAVRHLEFRDAKLRKRLVKFIKNDTDVATANDQIVLDATFVYDFVLPTIFKDSMLDPLKDYIHRYLVWGGLFDWYGSSLGSEQAEWYRGEIKDLEDAIVGMLSLPSIVKRPIQPFGPAKKMY